MGHADVTTNEIHTHVMQKNLAAVAIPLDALRAGGPLSPSDTSKEP